jgi:hypothetical protein
MKSWFRTKSDFLFCDSKNRTSNRILVSFSVAKTIMGCRKSHSVSLMATDIFYMLYVKTTNNKHYNKVHRNIF